MDMSKHINEKLEAEDKRIQNREELKTRFEFHPATGTQPERYAMVRKAFLDLALLIEELAPESRERSLAWTSLEQAQFYTNAAIARRENKAD